MVGGKSGRLNCFRLDGVVLKMLKIDADNQIRTVLRNFTNSKTSVIKGAPIIKWNHCKPSFFEASRGAQQYSYSQGLDYQRNRCKQQGEPWNQKV